MKITHIHVENFQGVATADVPISTPLAMLCGANGVGKSSVAEGVELAILGTPTRVSLKKHYGQMVTDGAEIGAVDVEFDHNGHRVTAAITLPEGTRTGEEFVPTSPVLPYLMNPARFAAADANAQRQLLFSLTGVGAKPDEIERRMLARGCRQDLITQMKPILRSGFAAGAEFAKKQATEAKGAWRSITGETWGSQKAVGWAARSPEYRQDQIDTGMQQVGELKASVDAQAHDLGRLEEQARAWAAHAQAATRQQKLIDSLPALQAKLTHDEGELAQWQTKVEALQSRAGTGPRQGLVHDLARAVHYLLSFEMPDAKTDDDLAAEAALAAYEAQHGKLDAQGDSEAAADLPRAIEARDLMKRCVDNDRRDIAAAQAAQTQTDAPEQVDAADVDAARQKLATARAALATVQEAVTKLQETKQLADGAARRTESARQAHEDIMGWTALGDALAPDGIPGDLLAEALKPLDERLAASHELTGWPLVTVDSDMTITAGGRVYGLLSESERWRVDAVIGEALAHLSGLRLLVLDRFDVLDLGGRADLLGWLDDLAARGEIETALVLGTLKQPPPAPSAAYTVKWIGTAPPQAELRKVA